MDVGFTTWYLKDMPADEMFAWAADNGLTGLEWDEVPAEPARLRAIMCRQPGVRVHTLGRCVNYLYGTDVQRAKRSAALRGDIETAAALGIGIVTVFAGRNPWKTVDENIPLFLETFAPLVELAEQHGVRLAMENCPQPQYWPAGGNLASTPENFRRLFEAIPSPALGLAFDPSHFVWLGADYVAAVREFGSRIFSVHAKDTEVLPAVLADRGIVGRGWWRYRLPGWGSVDWKGFFTALREVGYDGAICIEHEDMLWNGDVIQRQQGTLLAARFLRQFIE